MRSVHPPDIQLVITVALKKELPADWLSSRNVPVHTLAALKSGATVQPDSSQRGMLVIVTGAGLRASEEAAFWIRDNLSPLFVLNIGTCGLTDKRYSFGQWFSPGQVSHEDGDVIDLDRRLPVPYPGKIIPVKSLLSIKKEATGNYPAAWQKNVIVDMECYAQAKVFSLCSFTFHCIKFSTDYSDAGTYADFKRNLEVFNRELTKLFSFLDVNEDLTGVTAIVPVFNRERAIRDAVDSILSQSCLPEEIIVVDDCSTDGTGKVLERYKDRITVIRTQKNAGPSGARNRGIAHARTEWIAFLDSDDRWERDKVKGQIEYLKQYPFYQIMQSGEKWIRNGKRVNPCRHHKKPLGWVWEPSLERCLISPSGVLIRKSLLHQHGYFDETLPVCEDYDLWLRISRHHPVGLDPRLSVVKYGGHEDQLSRTYPAMDMYRVTSLLKALKNESVPEFRRKIIDILTRKLTILINGHEKRGNEKNARDYRVLRESLDEFR